MSEQLDNVNKQIIAKQAELNFLYAQAFLIAQSMLEQTVTVQEQVAEAEAEYGKGVYL